MLISLCYLLYYWFADDFSELRGAFQQSFQLSLPFAWLKLLCGELSFLLLLIFLSQGGAFIVIIGFCWCSGVAEGFGACLFHFHVGPCLSGGAWGLLDISVLIWKGNEEKYLINYGLRSGGTGELVAYPYRNLGHVLNHRYVLASSKFSKEVEQVAQSKIDQFLELFSSERLSAQAYAQVFTDSIDAHIESLIHLFDSGLMFLLVLFLAG